MLAAKVFKYYWIEKIRTLKRLQGRTAVVLIYDNY
jgi:hypothetical protein